MAEISRKIFWILFSLMQWAHWSRTVLIPKQPLNTTHKTSPFILLVGKTQSLSRPCRLFLFPCVNSQEVDIGFGEFVCNWPTTSFLRTCLYSTGRWPTTSFLRTSLYSTGCWYARCRGRKTISCDAYELQCWLVRQGIPKGAMESFISWQ